MVPEGWRLEALGEVVSFASGGTPSKSSPEYWGGDVPWITAKDLKFFRLSDSKDKVTRLACENGTKTVPAETVLILVRGMGLLKDIPLGVTVREMAFNQDIKALTTSSDLIAEFLAYALDSQKRIIMRMVTLAGHGTGRLETESLAALPVLLPPIQEQKGIISLLRTSDLCVQKVERLLFLKRTLKCGLMQFLLTGKQRSPRFARANWRTHRLGELFVERTERHRSDLPLLSITAERGVVRRNVIDRKDSSSEDKSQYKRIAAGDIGYNTMRMWQGVSALSDMEGIVSPAYTICIPDDKIDAKFASYLFKFPPLVHTFSRYSQGLVDDTLSLKFPVFAKIQVAIPEIKEQRWIASLLSEVDQQVVLLQKYADCLRLQKTALARKLLTGEIRIRAFSNA